jgi:hypothetical protein
VTSWELALDLLNTSAASVHSATHYGKLDEYSPVSSLQPPDAAENCCLQVFRGLDALDLSRNSKYSV